ncbi:hypothetical protein [Saccharopolyspora hattusasensis]|uniref:hypothetical protein n=1 Tax=Saccharopolyspora hattusasensis TaxID=1128679 RepID=UPI003D95385E
MTRDVPNPFGDYRWPVVDPGRELLSQLPAARDAATLTLALLSYRSAAELSLISSELEPETALDAARVLLTRIDEALRGLTA